MQRFLGLNQPLKASNQPLQTAENKPHKLDINVRKPRIIWVSLIMVFIINRLMAAELQYGKWKISGEIADVGISASKGPAFTNSYSLTGSYQDGRFLLNLTPIKTLDNGTESVSWDGKLLYLVQRWSDKPKEHPQPNHALAYIEPNVFSRYASVALQAALIAFANSNQLADLENGKTPVILGVERSYPEEKNKYLISQLSSGFLEIQAQTPGLEIGSKGLVPIAGFEQGFTRWIHKSNLSSVDATNGVREFSLEYRRYSPIHGKLIQNRLVTGTILIDLDNFLQPTFQPDITEDSLQVIDYSMRYDVLAWTKGILDWGCIYNLTNKDWKVDTNFINAQLSQLKSNMQVMDGPKDLLDRANTLSAHEGLSPKLSQRRRIIALIVFSAIFILFCVWLLRTIGGVGLASIWWTGCECMRHGYF